MQEDKIANESIDHYISTFPPAVQAILSTLRKVIQESAPDAKEKISYQMPTYEFHGNLVHFAAFKHHIGFYPAPSGIIEFEEELKEYQRSKGAIRFPMDKPLPYELISRIVQYRVAQNLEKAKSKVKKK